MKKIFGWTNSNTFANKWDRMALTNRGAFVAAWVSVSDDMYNACIFNELPGGDPIISCSFNSLDEAKHFADRELKRQGY